MNLGKYRNDLNNVVEILKEFSLLEELNIHKFQYDKSNKYTKQSKIYAKKSNYFECYKNIVENLDYDIILIDNSILQFSNDDGIMRYAFYPSPDEMDYKTFVKEILESNISDVGDSMYEEYSDYLNQLSNFVARTPIRYDYNRNLYVENEHTVSHIHFGFDKDFKINCNKELLPSLFVLFIIQNYFYSIWKKEKETYNKYIINLKQQCSELERDLFTDIDKQMIYAI